MLRRRFDLNHKRFNMFKTVFASFNIMHERNFFKVEYTLITKSAPKNTLQAGLDNDEKEEKKENYFRLKSEPSFSFPASSFSFPKSSLSLISTFA